MMKQLRRVSLWSAMLLLGVIGMVGMMGLWSVGCSQNPGPTEKNNQQEKGNVSGSDGGNPESVGEGTSNVGDKANTGSWTPPAGMAALEFSVDDSANKTYKAGQLLWNGSFRYDKATNTVTYSSAWQPTDGPFPPLYDDGPIDQGGHEPLGAKAGDNIWGVVVFVKPDAAQDLEFEYGLINDNNHWLWEGSNGLVMVKKGSTEVVKAAGLKLASHGNINIKISLDIAKLQKDFAVDDPKNPPLIFLKGTMTNWAHIQIQDKGKRGDEKEGDGIFTFVQAQNLDYSPHFGLLQHSRHVQFVFQFNAVTGREYKDVDDNALADGVQAWADCNGDGKFSDDEIQKIVWEKDSRGAVKNTTIVVCEGKDAPCSRADCGTERCKSQPICQQQGCKSNNECAPTEQCNTTMGKCEPKNTSCTKADCAEARCQFDPICQCKSQADCKTGEVCNTTTGKCEANKTCKEDKDCGQDQTCDTATGRCLSKTCTANDCKEARCQNDPVCTSSTQGPVVYFVQPGNADAGSQVAILGDRFVQGAKVEFGTTEATNVVVESAQKLTCAVPAGSGTVDVTVINPDGKRGLYPQGFTYGSSTVKPIASVDWCNVQWPKSIPDAANNIPDAVAGQPSPIIYGWVFKAGVTNQAGKGAGISAEVGIGPVGSNPFTDKNWKWWPATYNGDKAGLSSATDNDEYQGTVTPPAAGTYHYAFRFNGDGINYWYCTPAGNDKNTPYNPSQAPVLIAK